MEPERPLRLRSSIGPWLGAVIKQWGFYVSVLLTLIGAVQQVASGFKVPTGVLYGAAGLAFVFAQFRAYHNLRLRQAEETRAAAEREALLLAKLDVRERRKAIRESLGEFLREGEAIRERITRAGEPVAKSLADRMKMPGVAGIYYDPKEVDDPRLAGSIEASEQWESLVATFLTEYLGNSYKARFLAFGASPNEPPEMGAKRHTEAWRRMDRRLQTLGEILKEVGDDIVGG